MTKSTAATLRDQAQAASALAQDVTSTSAMRLLRNAKQRSATADAQLKHKIHITPSQAKTVVDEAVRALANQGRVYVRARTLVEVIHDPSASDWLTRPDGSPVIVPLKSARLRELLGEAALWYAKIDSDGSPVRAQVPPWVVETLEGREQWELPVLDGVTESPVFRADGTVLEVPGYDSATRLIYDPCGVQFPPVPERPTYEDARDAMIALLEPFAEFPFVDQADSAAVWR